MKTEETVDVGQPKAAVVSICSCNYIAKALAALSSFKRHNPTFDLFLGLVDRKSTIKGIPREINVFWVEDLGIHNLWSYAYRYDVIELNTNVKPAVLQKLLQSYKNVIYTDPDTYFYSKITSVERSLKSGSIVLTPHYTIPVLDGKKPDDIDLLRFGGFNLGFLALAASDNSLEFLKWWGARCLSDGYYEPQEGLAVDQKWVSLAVCFFEGVVVNKSPSLNLAFWNLHERTLANSDGSWLVNGIPLEFAHFSSLSDNEDELVAGKQTRYLKGERKDFLALAKEYRDEVKKYAREFNFPHYSFDYTAKGNYISPTARRIYGAMVDSGELDPSENPFDDESTIAKILKKRGLFWSKQIWRRQTIRRLDRRTKTLRRISQGLMLLARIVGPNHYFDVMKLLSHLSSIRTQTKYYNYKLPRNQ